MRNLLNLFTYRLSHEWDLGYPNFQNLIIMTELLLVRLFSNLSKNLAYTFPKCKILTEKIC